MSHYYLNLFRPYADLARNEMSVTRALIATCARSPNGRAFFNKLLEAADSPLRGRQDREWDFDLEVLASRVRDLQAGTRERLVLCITEKGGGPEPMWAELFSGLDDALRQQLSEIVPANGSTHFEHFEEFLRQRYPGLDRELRTQSDVDRTATIQSAHSDVWRLLWAGARPDAMIWNEQFICLVESKIWGSATEAQIRNHAVKSFGTGDVPVLHL